jgi:hypothetical protein
MLFRRWARMPVAFLFLQNSHSTCSTYGGPEPKPATATRPQQHHLLAQTAVGIKKPQACEP